MVPSFLRVGAAEGYRKTRVKSWKRCERTRLTWIRVFENAPFAESMRQFLETANEQNLDRLAREVGAGARKKV